MFVLCVCDTQTLHVHSAHVMFVLCPCSYSLGTDFPVEAAAMGAESSGALPTGISWESSYSMPLHPDSLLYFGTFQLQLLLTRVKLRARQGRADSACIPREPIQRKKNEDLHELTVYSLKREEMRQRRLDILIHVVVLSFSNTFPSS